MNLRAELIRKRDMAFGQHADGGHILTAVKPSEETHIFVNDHITARNEDEKWTDTL